MDEINLGEIIHALESIESQNLSKNQDIITWIKQITNNEFQLVDSLLNVFLGNINDTEMTSNILKVLR